jgi:hypothetical protein
MRLFDENIIRIDEGPAKHSEPHFTYLNRTARESFSWIREVIESWFEGYPSNDKEELFSRFRSTNDGQHLGAFFELYCYSLLQKLGFSVSVHCSLPNGELTKPDFLVHYNNQPLFYLEATCAFDSKQEVSTNKKVEILIDYINDMYSPNFFVGLDVKQFSANDIKLTRVRNILAQEFKKLDPDDISKQNEVTGRLYKIIVEDNGWVIEFSAIPKSPSARNKPDVGTYGMQMKGPDWVDSRKSLLSSLKEKSNKVR